MEYFLNQLINGLCQGSIYALMAIGYSVIVGVVGMVTFTYGEIMMIGAFSAYYIFLLVGNNLPLAILAAFAGSMISMGFVLVIARRVRQMSVLVVCGVMISYICSAITDFVVTFADDSNIVNLHNWSMGSFSGTTWDQVRVMTAVVIPVFVLSFCMAKPISAYQLGEEYARSLGVNVKRFRAELILLSSIL